MSFADDVEEMMEFRKKNFRIKFAEEEKFNTKFIEVCLSFNALNQWQSFSITKEEAEKLVEALQNHIKSLS